MECPPERFDALNPAVSRPRRRGTESRQGFRFHEVRGLRTKSRFAPAGGRSGSAGPERSEGNEARADTQPRRRCLLRRIAAPCTPK
jgi:hypothetical protein